MAGVHAPTGRDRPGAGGKVIVQTKGDNNPAPDPHRLQVTSPSVPVVVTSLDDAGRLGLALRGGPLRLVLLFVIAICAVVGARRILTGGR